MFTFRERIMIMVKEFGKYYCLIASKYQEIKNNFSIAYKRFSGENLDEDIFHTTLLKCAETINETNMTEQDLLNYTYIALRSNMLREKKYLRNKKCVQCDDEFDKPYQDNQEYWNLRCNLRQFIVDKYDEDTFEQCCEWIIDNDSVKDIEARFNTKGLYYKFKKIKNDIIKHFGNDLFDIPIV